ncbi:pre-ribosomal (17S) RNA binding factor A [Candidatus Hydrogenisulfobacillus filiaventi]|uniref:Ribosome-binding factor A n=1 Tax=Candidatus Hydrogenisulfobacillus filiaventi TaxID=2707344 RepID=A0A6F8ZGI0_9FIRM|nr:30S ribosome-binding factor RbfA [Bacillota bacterium]CAB1128773.1 pre-ribosomal (17S) RNA binding factor A [Candidatus Hydrogenisulfobacillus filiaventi]
MNKARAERIGQAMQQEIGAMLQREVKDPRIGFVSVTRVEVSRDLSRARVYVSLFGDAGEQADSLEGLRSAAAFLRGEVARRLHLLKAPQLEFVQDHAIDASLRVHALLREIEPRPGKPGDGEPPA